MKNGDLAEFSSDGQSFSQQASTATPSAEAYGVKLCPGGVRVALLESAGVFSLNIFPNDSSETVSFL